MAIPAAFEDFEAGQTQQDKENDRGATAYAALWKLLRSWGVDAMDRARMVRHEIEREVDLLEDPVKRAMYRPIPGINHNRLWLVLHDTDARPPTNPNRTEEENRDADRLFASTGARAVRELAKRLESTFDWFRQPDQLQRRGTQRHFARLYVAVRTVTDFSTNDEPPGNRDPRPRKPVREGERPSLARVYDYYLGGTANWAIDREFGDRVLEQFPRLRDIVLANQLLLNRVVRYLTKRGVRQFLDIGAGVPAEDNTHQVADEVMRYAGLVPDARVVYVDNEPVTVVHAEMLLDSEGDPARHAVVHADLRDPDELWHKALETQLLDPNEPIAVLLIAKLHVVQRDTDGNDIVPEAVARIRGLLPRGSYLAISHITDEGIPPGLSEKLVELKRMYDESSGSNAIWRSRAEISALLDGFRLVEPGWTWTPEWHPEETGQHMRTVTFRAPSESVIWTGVGEKAT